MGQANFDWIVNAVAEMAVKMATEGQNPVRELRWAEFLAGADTAKTAAKKKAKAPKA